MGGDFPVAPSLDVRRRIARERVPPMGVVKRGLAFSAIIS